MPGTVPLFRVQLSPGAGCSNLACTTRTGQQNMMFYLLHRPITVGSNTDNYHYGILDLGINRCNSLILRRYNP
jgi:hypothetical protein